MRVGLRNYHFYSELKAYHIDGGLVARLAAKLDALHHPLLNFLDTSSTLKIFRYAPHENEDIFVSLKMLSVFVLSDSSARTHIRGREGSF